MRADRRRGGEPARREHRARARRDRARESRGTHTRSDFPEPSAEFLGRFVFAGDAEPDFVPLAGGEPEPTRMS